MDAGFFGWKDAYSSILPYDNPPSDYLMVNLASAKKTVSVTMTEPPQGYADFFNQVSSGAGAAGALFSPAWATLIAEQTSQEPQAV